MDPKSFSLGQMSASFPLISESALILSNVLIPNSIPQDQKEELIQTRDSLVKQINDFYFKFSNSYSIAKEQCN